MIALTSIVGGLLDDDIDPKCCLSHQVNLTFVVFFSRIELLQDERKMHVYSLCVCVCGVCVFHFKRNNSSIIVKHLEYTRVPILTIKYPAAHSITI